MKNTILTVLLLISGAIICGFLVNTKQTHLLPTNEKGIWETHTGKLIAQGDQYNTEEVNPMCLLSKINFLYFAYDKDIFPDAENSLTKNLIECSHDVQKKFITTELDPESDGEYKYRLNTDGFESIEMKYRIVAKNSNKNQYIVFVTYYTESMHDEINSLVRISLNNDSTVMERSDLISGQVCTAGASYFALKDGMIVGEIEVTPNMMYSMGQNKEISLGSIYESTKTTTQFLNGITDCYAKMNFKFNPSTLSISQDSIEFFFDDNEIVLEEVPVSSKSKEQACFDSVLKLSLRESEYMSFSFDDFGLFAQKVTDQCMAK